MAPTLSRVCTAAVLRVYRKFDQYVVSQAVGRWQPEPLPARGSYKIGVLGLGVIGAAIATALAHHGFAVRGHARTRKQIDGVDCRAGEIEFAGFLGGLDVLISTLPATEATRGRLGHEALSRLAPGARDQRGPGLGAGRGRPADAARHRAARWATLDVFATEPLPPDHPFWRRREIVITPHVSAETELEPAIEQVADKLARWSRGETVSGGIDRARGY